MIFIHFNIPGALYGLLGLAAGVLVVVVSGGTLLTFGLITASVIWIAACLLPNKDSSGKRRFPSVLFIPLFVYGMAGMLLAALILAGGFIRSRAPLDLREVWFDRDTKALDGADISGVSNLSLGIRRLFDEKLPGEGDHHSWHYFSQTNSNSVMALVSVPGIWRDGKKQRAEFCRELVRLISEYLATNAACGDKQRYIGVKDRLFLYALQTPHDTDYSICLESGLYPYYGRAPLMLSNAPSNGSK